MFIWSLLLNFCTKKKRTRLDYEACEPWVNSSCLSDLFKPDFSIWEGHEECAVSIGATSVMVVSMTKLWEWQSILPTGYQHSPEGHDYLYSDFL